MPQRREDQDPLTDAKCRAIVEEYHARGHHDEQPKDYYQVRDPVTLEETAERLKKRGGAADRRRKEPRIPAAPSPLLESVLARVATLRREDAATESRQQDGDLRIGERRVMEARARAAKRSVEKGKKGKPPDEVKAVVLRHDNQGYVRTPGLMAAALLSPVETVEVDGKPVGSAAPVQVLRRLPAPVSTEPRQQDLLPGPQTLDDAAVDPVLAMVSRIEDWTDRRSPLRSDLLLLVRLGCAILRPVAFDLDGWARLLRGYGGRVQASARSRAQRALTTGAVIVWQDNLPYQMIRAITEDNGMIAIHPSADAGWWRGGRGFGDAWRLSGGLWRRHWAGAKQGGHRRMAEGIEAALAWTPPGARSRISMALQPSSKQPGSHPGTEYYIGWQRAMYLSGEPYPAANDANTARTCRNRFDDFVDAGYKAEGSAAAPAGDTWEITRRLKGGIYVRASARYVEAVRLSQSGATLRRCPWTHSWNRPKLPEPPHRRRYPHEQPVHSLWITCEQPRLPRAGRFR